MVLHNTVYFSPNRSLPLMLLNTSLINSKTQKTINDKKLIDIGKNMYPKMLYNAALVNRYTIAIIKDVTKAVK